MDKKIYSVFARLSFIVIVFTLAASSRPAPARARSRQPSHHRGAVAKSPTAPVKKETDARVDLKLTDEESRMAQGSRAAIIAAGFSEAYFDAHFSLSRVVNTQNDRRVVWRYSLGEYSTVVSDSLGFYADEKGRRTDTHSARTTLHSAHDVLRVIPKRRAERIMRSCIGAFTGGAVVMQADGAGGRTALVFTAASVPKPRREDRAGRKERERRERDNKERTEGAREQRQMDTPKEDEDEGGDAPMYIGSVNLETGRCTKGQAVSDHPVVRRKG
jgi:hypothetical protein